MRRVFVVHDGLELRLYSTNGSLTRTIDIGQLVAGVEGAVLR